MTNAAFPPAHAPASADSPLETLRVVLAEDHERMRASLRLLLDNEPDVEVVAEAGTLSTAVSQVHAYRPDVLVLDLRMPDGSSIDALRSLRATTPGTEIVVLTMEDDPAFAEQAFDAGAMGVVLKDTADADLPTAIRRAVHGEVYSSPRAAPGSMSTKRL